MSKIVYELPVTALVDGYADYKEKGGLTRMFLCDHNDFQRGDLVYWFDPNEKVSDFAFIKDFKVDGINESGIGTVTFVLKTRGVEEKSETVIATLGDIIKIIGVVSSDCNWLEDGEWLDDTITVAKFAIPVDEEFEAVEGDDTVGVIPVWTVYGADTVLMQNVIQIYNEHCFHYH